MLEKDFRYTTVASLHKLLSVWEFYYCLIVAQAVVISMLTKEVPSYYINADYSNLDE